MSRHSHDGYRQAYVKCPFYRSYTKNSIRCEGFMDGVGIACSFRDHKDQMIHMDVFCQDRYENCEIYRMVLDTRYEEA